MARQTDSDIEYIRAVAELFKETGLAELSVRRDFGDGNGRLAVRLARHVSARPAAAVPAVEVPAQSPADAPPVSVSVPEEASGSMVHSPMVGTAYLGPEPGADPFVTPGDAVQKGAALLIVEAMKTMNYIEAPQAGIVKAVLVDDGEPVEFGTPLVVFD